MPQSTALIDTLKSELKSRHKTYKDVAQALQLSEASIKRLFAEKNLTLHRLEKIAELLDLEISDLVELMQQQQQRITQLSYQQEKELVADLRLLLVANCLLNHWTFDDIIENYRVTEHQAIQYMAKLDRMNIIQLLPDNRVKLMVSRDFGWIEQGPIQQFFEAKVQSEFFQCSFTGVGETRLFLNGMLSKQSNQIIKDKIQRLAKEYNQLHHQDKKLAVTEREGTSILLALRPWELKAFVELRRDHA